MTELKEREIKEEEEKEAKADRRGGGVEVSRERTLPAVFAKDVVIVD